jgi:hypothetical protein
MREWNAFRCTRLYQNNVIFFQMYILTAKIEHKIKSLSQKYKQMAQLSDELS